MKGGKLKDDAGSALRLVRAAVWVNPIRAIVRPMASTGQLDFLADTHMLGAGSCPA